MPVISAHYAEIALKGRNRNMFVKRLKNNMFQALGGEPVRTINHVESRLLVRLDEAGAVDRVVDKLRRVFGIQWLSASLPVPRTADPAADLARVSEVATTLAERDAAGAPTSAWMRGGRTRPSPWIHRRSTRAWAPTCRKPSACRSN